MITLNDLNVGTGLTAYGVHCTVEITIPEQDYIIARLDNGQVTHISSESLAMFPERYVLDITRKQSITGNSLTNGDVFKVHGATITIGNVSPDGFAMFSTKSVRGYRMNRQHVDTLAYQLNNMNAVKA